ncbi:MAG: hypothetical protein NVSMB6_32040 [Burkholderiaceae bacterium]
MEIPCWPSLARRPFLKEGITGSVKIDVFASANMEHPLSLSDAKENDAIFGAPAQDIPLSKLINIGRE